MLGNGFLDMTHKKTLAIKDKLKFFKIKNSRASKNSMNKVKKITYRMEKISASYISDKGLVSKIYKVLLNLNNKKKIIQFFK